MKDNIKRLKLSSEEMDELFRILRHAKRKKDKEKASWDIWEKSGHTLSIANRYFEKIELCHKRIEVMIDQTELTLEEFSWEVKNLRKV